VTKLSSDKILKQLENDDPEQRRKAVEALGSWKPERALPHLLRVRREDESEELQELATATLKELGLILDLSPMGADSWFDQVKDSSPAFETLCDVLGERFVGYALIVGVQISGLTIDQFTPSNTLVEFKLVESNPPRTLRLPDFRRELVSWILTESPAAESVAPPLDLAQAQQLVGVRYILLAPLHGVSLKEVILEKPGRSPEASVVAVHTGADNDQPEEISVAALREQLEAKVEDELEAARDHPFELDFDLVDAAEKAASAGEWEEVVELIGHWPGPLSMLSRMQMGANLDDEKRARIGVALTYLARAYRATGRSAWAEELYRLGLQFAGESPEGATLYQALGEAMIEEKRFGEAIGPLRRALALGGKMATVGPALGLAFVRCGRAVAATAVLEKALDEGATKEAVLPILGRAHASIGDAIAPWRELHPGWVNLAEAKKASAEVDNGDNGEDGIDGNDRTIEMPVTDDMAHSVSKPNDD